MTCSSTSNSAKMNWDFNSAEALRYLIAPTPVSSLPSEEKSTLSQARWTTRVIEKGHTLLDQGECRTSVYVLTSGWAFRYQTLSDGKRQILDFIFAGALVGFGSGNAYTYGVETVTNCVVASLPTSGSRHILAKSPTLAICVAERISDGETRAHEHMTTLGRKSARERVSTLIVELIKQSHASGDGSKMEETNLPLTQIMIGDALGLSNEHVCRMLSSLAQDRIVEINRNTLRVLNPSRLAREAGLDPIVFVSRESALALAA